MFDRDAAINAMYQIEFESYSDWPAHELAEMLCDLVREQREGLTDKKLKAEVKQFAEDYEMTEEELLCAADDNDGPVQKDEEDGELE